MQFLPATYTDQPVLMNLAAFVTACCISIYAVRKIIFITEHRKIYDIPDDVRKFHGVGIPSLGGVGIFIGFVFSSSLFCGQVPVEWSCLMAAAVLLFFTGIYDDIMNMRPVKKLVAQLLAVLMAVLFAGIRADAFAALFVGQLPAPVGMAFTIFAGAFFINVFNFIDGIDGLACSMAILYTSIIGLLLTLTGAHAAAVLAFSLSGATLGLLFFNRSPARIYMGDTGSMLLGFAIFTLASILVAGPQVPVGLATNTPVADMPVTTKLVAAMLFFPVFDAIRVFAVRISKGLSPLRADRNHLHYYLLDSGLGHTAAVGVILLLQAANVLLAVLLRGLNPFVLMLVLAMLCSLVSAIVFKARVKIVLPGRVNKVPLKSNTHPTV